MDEETFNKLMDARFAHCKSLMAPKAVEYSRNGDKLHNFKRAAMFEDCSPEMALRGMLTKHIVSIYDIIDDINDGKIPSKELINEKFSDTINYICLLEGLIEDNRLAIEEY